ncbi:MAG: diguanylate cyclase [Ruminococcaceae bacterium]|nr:diguanylate cyclase [Oscillospiraceae bacterium]
MKNRTRKLSTTTRYLLLLAAFSILANTILGILLTRQSNAAIKSLMRSRMLDISNTAADMLDGDILRDISPADEGTAEYRSVMETLRSFQDNIGLSYIYCIRDEGIGNFTFGLDPALENPAEFGAPVECTDALYQASRGTSAVDEVPHVDDWGAFYSAYSPVFDSSGKVAGIVGVDFTREWYDEQSGAMLRTTVLTCAASLVVGVAVALVLIDRSRKRVHTVNEQLGELSVSMEALMLEVRNLAGVDAPGSGVEMEQYDIDDLESLTQRLAAMKADLNYQIGKVHEQAYYDPATGVMNKECYLSTQKVMDDMVREGLAEFSILIFNLNELIEINIACGHAYGDMAVKDTADVLSSVFGRDRVFRIGGGEFIVIAETTSKSDMQSALSSVELRVAKENVKEKPYKLHLSLSMGYAVLDPETDHEYMDVFRRAESMRNEDVAAYAAKHDGESARKDGNDE